MVFALVMSISFSLVGQSSALYKNELQHHFEEYFIQTVDVNQAVNQLRNINQFQEFEIADPKGGKWVFDLVPSNIISEDFVFTKMEKGKKIEERNIQVFPYRGFIKGDPYSRVTLTVADGFFQGTVHVDGLDYSFQNLNKFIKTADATEILVYENSKSIDNELRTCKQMERVKQIESSTETQKSELACKGLQLAYANDFLMYQSYGNGILAHNVATVNETQSDYSNDFNDEIEFTIEEIFVPITSDDDPWTLSTDIGELLNDFTSWSTSGGFGVIFDLATLWSDRNFDGPPVGVAWVDAVCTNSRQNVIQDYTANSSLMRVVFSHEIGHNFSAVHDAGGSGFIMSPAVNNTSTWSPASINDINNAITGYSCLTGCQGFFSAPTADFSHDLSSSCSPVTVNFFDESNGDIVSWIWLFPGGSPEYSTEPNPSVFYSSDGVYDVTLTVATDGGADEVTSFGEIVLTSILIPDFDFVTSGSTAIFTNNSTPITGNFLWDFGDGNTSTAVNPQHTYAQDGFYQVVLTIISSCGDVTYDEWVEIATAPEADFYTNSTFDCQPFTVEFLNNSSANVVDYFWEFEGGTPATSTDVDPVVVYNDAGIFDVSLTVSNNNGSDQFQLFDYIEVDPLPQANFTTSVNMSTVNFTNTSTDELSVLWNFGDGNSSAMSDPTHTYAMDGTYTVEITATNNCGTDTYTQTVVINNGPFSVINYDTNSGCADLTVNFDGSASANTSSYDWSFEGGTPASSTAMNPVVEYASAGTYDVSLIVTDETTNDTLEMLNLIMVNDVPSSMATVSSDTMTLYGIAIPDATFNTVYTWDFGDGNTAVGDTVLHTYAAENIYEVILTAENECGSTSDTSYLNLYSIPTANYSTSLTSGCAPLQVSFTDNSTIAVTDWEWSFPGGTPNNSTQQNPTVTYADAGTYDVALIVSNPAGTDTLNSTAMITVDDVPEVAFLAVNNLTTVTFTNQSTNATSYLWDFGDGNSSMLANPEHSYMQEGTYTVVLTATNACGTVTESQTIVVNQLPSAGFLFDTDNGCIPFDVSFTDASSMNVTGWEWSFEGGTPASSTDPSPTVSYGTTGVFDVQLIVDSPAGKDTLNMMELISSDDVPNVLFSYIQTTEFDFEFNNESTNATAYMWEFGDGTSSIEENPTHSYEEAGVYTVTLRASNDCGTVMWTEEIIIVESSVQQIPGLTDLKILPNPNRGNFVLQLDMDATNTLELEILNILGQSLINKDLTLKNGLNNINIDLDDLTDGTYLLSLNVEGKRLVKKFIVNK